jgi:peptidoglycan/LPS O-acetylase OafA/YrhL
LILPLVLAAMIWASKGAQNPFKGIPLLFAVIASAALAARFLTAELPFQVERNLIPTHLRIDSLLFGVLLAYYYHFYRERFSGLVSRHVEKLAIAGCLLLEPMIWAWQHDRRIYTYGFTLIFLGYGCLMIAFIHAPIKINLPLRIVAHMGTFSYSIYLCHLPWLTFVKMLPLDGAVRMALYCVGSVVLGIGLGKVIELPALRLRNSLFPPATVPTPVLVEA